MGYVTSGSKPRRAFWSIVLSIGFIGTVTVRGSKIIVIIIDHESQTVITEQSVSESAVIVMFKCIQQYLSYPSIIKMKIEERDSNWDFPRIIFCLNSLHSLSLSNRMPYKGTF